MTTLLQEIQSKCSPELIASRDHQAIADAVNVGRTKIVSRLGGVGLVLETLGPVDGAALLDQLEALAATNSAVKWAFVLINRGELDFGSPATRAMIDALVAEPARSLLKAVAVQDDPVSPSRVANALDGGE
jgi:hypothetical protein